MFIQTWILPFALLAAATLIAFPLSRYMAWIMEGKYRPLPIFRWIEKRLDSGPQNWKQYTVSLLLFNVLMFVLRLCGSGAPAVDAAESGWQRDDVPHDHLSSRDLVHDEHGPPALFRRTGTCRTSARFSSASPCSLCLPRVGLCALTAIIRALRGDSKLGNYFVDMWRMVVYMFVPDLPLS